MNSDHLHKPDATLGGRLHDRDTAVNTHHHGANGHGSRRRSSRSNVNLDGQTINQLPSHARKRRSPRTPQDRADGQVRINVNNNNYAKYGKRRVRRKRLPSENLLGAVCVCSFVLGFAWMYFTRGDVAQTRPRLRNLGSWKPRSNKPLAEKHHPKPSDYRLQIPHQNKNLDQSHDQPQSPPNRLLIPRFDIRQFISSWEKNARDAALRQVGQKRPQSIVLEGWNFPVSFRSFPFAKQTFGPIKNVDSDYGNLAYHTLRNEANFARIIQEDGGGEAAHGAFDPDSIYPEGSLQNRNRRRRKTPGSYPDLDSKGRKVLREHESFEQLHNYFDDDKLVHVLPKANDGMTATPRACQKAEFSQLYFPTCNGFHERDVGRPYDDPDQLLRPRPENELIIKYLDHGYYRDVWIAEDEPWIWPSRYTGERRQKAQKYGVEDEERTAELVAKAYRSAALKTLQIKHPYNEEHFQEIQGEAIIMERMTYSPRIMDIYGHCGFATLVEVVPIELEEAMVPGEGTETREAYDRRNADDVHPRNNFTVEEKLGLVLQMAESLADLHGFAEGVIVHDDVQPCQWLRTPDGRLKLGDFNRATIMQWDAMGGGYCRFNNGQGFSQYRAPEEYAVRNLNEQIDTFSFGNNIYGLLTGLWNFHDTEDDDVVHKKLIDGELSYIDPRYRERSYAEGRLVELMERCWLYDPDDRISIFDAVDFLRVTVKENKARSKE